mmetsp:Transcript_25563/g.54284  ORF Transcript_25563/g.54284 Transcript_25563/m.54284 type:complete len:611 (-) Transcript_25563:74-1906(-)|eukprot:CAMPEP_0171386104 /NCGR_PEP_ID=MMETSP0879-20121228/39321_1 /TAXON_ID=67004 /ORGANISM="Thalassiosira weissflogii, Strain CCMP1336" /LENGTH=610 /DNA_ID=CAMNT_0011898417 /DNA_START=38 /DNA_END=1873 /DNA_ORIENTATION=+
MTAFLHPVAIVGIIGVVEASRLNQDSKFSPRALKSRHGLPNIEDLVVKQELLEKNYPGYKEYNGEMHAGLMPAANLDQDPDDYSSYFFWLFQPDADVMANDDTVESFRDDTLVIWLNGGPGCSSMVGLMAENGPVTIPKYGPGITAPNPSSAMDAPLVANPFAWTKKSAMLWVEQPGGTGFSTASKQWTGKEADDRTEDDVADDFYAFLQNVYNVFGEDLRRKKLYVTGESYAGMYIPSIARGIHLGNERVRAEGSDTSRIINLSGVAIGNGWIDAKIQGPTTIDFAFWHGMIDLRTYRSLHEKWDQCISRELTDTSYEPLHPFTTPDECGISVAVMEASGSTFMYDVTTYDTYDAVVKPGGTVSRFFNDPDVRTALNLPSMEEKPYWLACVPGSGRRRKLKSSRELILLENDQPLSVVPYVAELLDDAKIDVLFYNGDLDLACPIQSTEMSLETMEWSGKSEWMNQEVTQWMEWRVDGQPSGHTKKFNNLQLLAVYNSGHFVPINQARNSLNLIGRLLDGKGFGDRVLPQFPMRQDIATTVTGPYKGDHSDRAHASHGFSIFTAICGFVIGLIVSYFFSGQNKSHNRHLSMESSSSVPQTETTPLNGKS